METGSIFYNNTTQAIRLPKSVAFPEYINRVTIRKEGESLIISPEGSGWDNFFNHPDWWGDDTQIERGEQIPADRENLF